MSSARRIASSRANGALSKGPKTEEGKRRAALAHMRHGLLSKCVVIENESQELFDLVVTQHVEFFKPRNAVEQGMVEDIACTYWRLRRVMAIETSMFSAGVRKQDPVSEVERLELAFAQLCDSSKFNVLNRYEARLQRSYQRALRNLAALWKSPANRRKVKKTQKFPLNPLY
jgi:hypothetical protein